MTATVMLRRKTNVLRWRMRNRGPTRLPVPADLEGVTAALKRDGVAIVDSDVLFAGDAAIAAATETAEQGYLRFEAGAIPPLGENKEFKAHLLPEKLHVDDAALALALHPNLLAIASAYLGVPPLLRDVQIWATIPTEGDAASTQLWHRDADDVVNLKAFVYLNAVPVEAGPFCYAPKTHPYGRIVELPAADDHGRTTDDQMAAVVAREDWLVCTGPAGTVVLADTCGYHKQLKPIDEHRLLLAIQFTSRSPKYPPTFAVEGDTKSLAEPQRNVLSA